MIQSVWPQAQPKPIKKPPSLCEKCRRKPKCMTGKYGHGGWIETCTMFKPLKRQKSEKQDRL